MMNHLLYKGALSKPMWFIVGLGVAALFAHAVKPTIVRVVPRAGVPKKIKSDGRCYNVELHEEKCSSSALIASTSH